MADSITNVTRVRFTSDDPAGLWLKDDEAIDLGPEVPGLPLRVLQITKRQGMMDECVSLTDPYERGLIEVVK